MSEDEQKKPDNQEELIAKGIDEILKKRAEEVGPQEKAREDAARAAEEKAGQPRMDMYEPSPFDTVSQDREQLMKAFKLPNIPEPTEEQMDRYLVALLEDRRFTDTFAAFGGKFPIEFQTRTVDENHAILRNLRIAILVGDVGADNYDMHMTLIQYFTLAFSLLRIKETAYRPIDAGLAVPVFYVGPNLTEAAKKSIPKLKSDPLYKALTHFVRDCIEKWNETKLDAVMKAAYQFEGMVRKIGTKASSENF